MSNLITMDNLEMLLNNCNEDQLAMMQSLIINRQMADISKRMGSLEAQVTEQADGLVKLRKEHELSKTLSEEQLELERKRHRRAEDLNGFKSQRDLGFCYSVSVGSKSMGMLLKMSGIATKNNRTTPTSYSIKFGYAKSLMYGDYPTFQYNPDKCIKKIDRWLEDKGLINEFYSYNNEVDLQKFISGLFGEWLKENQK